MAMTVKDYMENELAGLLFEPDEFERAVAFAMREINKGAPYNRMQTIDGGYILLKDCWNMSADNLEKESLRSLYNWVEFETLLWCRNELHSRK